jgi:guanylate kinase
VEIIDFQDYTPAGHALDRLRQVDFIAVVGPTAVGKDTVMAAAANVCSALHKVVSDTCRLPRSDERSGVDYMFRTKAEMLECIANGEYVQVAPTVLGDLYATHAQNYPVEGIGMMAVWADAMPVFRVLPFKRIRCFYILPPSWEVWQERLQSRTFTSKQLQMRMNEAKRSLAFALNDSQTCFVINNGLSEAAKDFVELALGRPMSKEVKASQQQARKIVRGSINQLDAYQHRTKSLQ